MNIIDTSPGICSLYDNGRFDLDRWKIYMEKYIPGAAELCLSDMEECLGAGYSWEESFLPVLESVMTEPFKREMAVRSFRVVTGRLDERIAEVFGRTVDADVVLYVGLCGGAGWVARIGGRTTVLLGIEKIIELDWCGVDDMTGLIIHELGHVWHSRYGLSAPAADRAPDEFLRQLFSEGVAMVFEQEVVGSADYFHQDKNGWKRWCDEHAEFILRSFARDLPEMTRENQRYFGDWVSLEGCPDTGYYLGARFVRYLLGTDSFNNIIKYDMNRIRDGFDSFLSRNR